MRELFSLLFQIDFGKKVDCLASNKEVARKYVLAGYTVVINISEPDGEDHIVTLWVMYRAIYTAIRVLYHDPDRLLVCCRFELFGAR